MRTHWGRGFPGLVLGLVFALAVSAKGAEKDPFEAVTEVARRALPAVVSIEAHAPEGSPAAEILGRNRKGTGMLIDPSGWVLTSNHVVAGADRIFVTLTDGRRFPGEMAGNDAQTDLALVRVKGEGFSVLPLGRSTGLRLGEGVVVIGSGAGKDREVTLGTVNAIGPFVAYWEFMLDRVIQTDAFVRQGYSGGPLLNLRGEVVGVVSYLRPTAPGLAGLVIPIEAASALRRSLSAGQGGFSAGDGTQRTRRAWLGASVIPRAGGIAIQGLTPGGPATRANLLPKDVITHVNAVPVMGLETYYRQLWKHAPGSEIRLTILRAGERRVVPVRSADRDRFFAPSGK